MQDDKNTSDILLNTSKIYLEDTHNSVLELNKEPKFRETIYEKKSKLNIFDGAEYFFEKLGIISFKFKENYYSPEFRPTFDDVLHCRRKTTGVIETQFQFSTEKKIYNIKLTDVGGQSKKFINQRE
jgi:hypothetical protein